MSRHAREEPDRGTGRAWVLGVVLLGVVVGVPLWIGPRLLLQRLIVAVSEDTEYAPGYSDAAFDAVVLGDSEAGVLATLGKPLSEAPTEPFSTLLYAVEPQPGYEQHGTVLTGSTFTEFTFDADGRLWRHWGQRADAGAAGRGAVLVGDGQNSLGLSNAEVQALREGGADEAAIEGLYGPARSRYASHVSRWLHDSRSPGSTHDHLRWIGLDAAGRVVEKRSEVYWD